MNAVSFSSLPEARKKLGVKNIRELINKTHDIAQQFRQKETQLIEILQQLDHTKAYRATGFNSLFQFCVESLQLTEHQSFNYITVARKCTEIPELMVALEDRRITVSKARRINSVINADNQKDWIFLAEKSSQRDLEKAVRAKDPQPSVRDHLQILSETEVKLQATLSRSVEEKLQRVMELLRDKTKKSVKINSTLETLCDEYLKKHDPLEKEKRSLSKTNNKLANRDSRIAYAESAGIPNSARAQFAEAESFTEFAQKPQRTPVPAQIKHQVILRDGGQCRFHREGQRCKSRQFVEIHHRIPISRGGKNKLTNFVLLCSEHHAAIHAGFEF